MIVCLSVCVRELAGLNLRKLLSLTPKKPKKEYDAFPEEEVPFKTQMKRSIAHDKV
jgi:hypothetical protein